MGAVDVGEAGRASLVACNGPCGVADAQECGAHLSHPPPHATNRPKHHVRPHCLRVCLGNAETLEDDLSEGGDNSVQYQTGAERTVARFHATADMFIARDVEQDEPTTDGPQVKRAAYAVQGQLILASKGAGKTMEPPFLPAVRTRLACLRLQMRLAQGQ